MPSGHPTLSLVIRFVDYLIPWPSNGHVNSFITSTILRLSNLNATHALIWNTGNSHHPKFRLKLYHDHHRETHGLWSGCAIHVLIMLFNKFTSVPKSLQIYWIITKQSSKSTARQWTVLVSFLVVVFIIRQFVTVVFLVSNIVILVCMPVTNTDCCLLYMILLAVLHPHYASVILLP